MQQLLAVHLAGRPVAERLPGPVVDQGKGPADPPLRHPGEVRPLREELPDEVVVVVVRALLPGAVGLAEVELRAPEPGRDVCIRRELLAPVGGDRLDGPAPRAPATASATSAASPKATGPQRAVGPSRPRGSPGGRPSRPSPCPPSSRQCGSCVSSTTFEQKGLRWKS